MRVYELDAGESAFPNLRHDSIHVMTGCGIGIADEMRVAIVEEAMVNAPSVSSVSRAFKRAARIRELFVNNYRDPVAQPLNISPAGLQSEAFNLADAKTEMLSAEEVAALYEQGREMDRAIEKLTGKPYRNLFNADYAAIDFSQVDFTAQVSNIKLKHMLEGNAEVEKATAKILFDTATAKGHGHDIPAPQTPWVGPLRKGFGA